MDFAAGEKKLLRRETISASLPVDRTLGCRKLGRLDLSASPFSCNTATIDRHAPIKTQP